MPLVPNLMGPPVAAHRNMPPDEKRRFTDNLTDEEFEKYRKQDAWLAQWEHYWAHGGNDIGGPQRPALYSCACFYCRYTKIRIGAHYIFGQFGEPPLGYKKNVAGAIVYQPVVAVEPAEMMEFDEVSV